MCCHPSYCGRQACGRTSRGHTGRRSLRISHSPSFCAVCLNFPTIRIQPFLSLVDREVEFCVLTNKSFSTCWAFFISFYYYYCEEKSRLPEFELTSERQRVSRLSTESLGRPVVECNACVVLILVVCVYPLLLD